MSRLPFWAWKVKWYHLGLMCNKKWKEFWIYKVFMVDLFITRFVRPNNTLRITFPEGPSTVFCVAVTAWTVVISPSTISKLSLMTLASGAKQLVVQEALEITFSDGSYDSRFTPTTNIGASALGAEMITFLAPPSKCACNRWIAHYNASFLRTATND